MPQAPNPDPGPGPVPPSPWKTPSAATPKRVALANTLPGTVPAQAPNFAGWPTPQRALKSGSVQIPGRDSDDPMNVQGALSGNRQYYPTGNPYPVGGAPMARVSAAVPRMYVGAGPAAPVQQATAEAVQDANGEQLPTENATNYIFDRAMGERFRIPDGPQVRAKPKRLAGRGSRGIGGRTRTRAAQRAVNQRMRMDGMRLRFY